MSCGGDVCRASRSGWTALRARNSLTGGILTRRPRHHHSVYVVELSPDVLLEPRFVRANPGYEHGKPCVYVGMTGLNPDERFDKHKAGVKANRYVLRYGLRLLPALYEVYNPMPYGAAQEMEVELGIALREEGYGVWQG